MIKMKDKIEKFFFENKNPAAYFSMRRLKSEAGC